MSFLLFFLSSVNDLLDSVVYYILGVSIKHSHWIARLYVVELLRWIILRRYHLLTLSEKLLSFELKEETAAYFIILVELTDLVTFEDILLTCFDAFPEELL